VILRYRIPLLAFLASLLFLFPTFSQAQISITAAGTFVKTGQAPPSDAISEVKLFQSIGSKFPMKEKAWKYVIVADDTMWKQLMVKMGFDPNTPLQYFGQTDIDHSITFIRGWALIHPELFGQDPEHIIAHEMAHIYLHSRDEKLVDDQAVAWIKASKKNTVQVAGVR
jgi:hypothetical protein